jgi:CspA family cold shock protein
MEGTVKWYDAVKGFGFIQTSENKDIFVHRSELLTVFLNCNPIKRYSLT